MTSSAYDALPGVSGWPLVGNIPHFTRGPLAFLENLREEHGPVVRFRMAKLRYVQMADPEGIEQVLITKNDAFQKHKYLRWTLGDALGNGLLVAEDDAWRKRRTTAQPSFRPKRIREYAPAMLGQTDRLLRDWATNPTRSLHEDMTTLTLRIAAQTLSDVTLDEQASSIGESLDATMQRFSSDNRLLMMLPKTVPFPMNIRYRTAKARLHGIVEELITGRDGSVGSDLMSRLIRAYQASDTDLDRDDLRDELVTFLAAGHETTALSLTWTSWLLAAHPDIQARLAHRLDEALDGEAPTLERLDKVPLLDAVIDESMRLLPPVWAIGREAQEDVTVSGHTLPEGTQVLMPQWVVHRDPHLWKDPGRFEPARWLDERDGARPRFAHFPFGGGPRRCIGDSFAMIETRLCLARILSTFQLTTAQEERPEIEPSITLRPAGPVKVDANPRAGP